MSGYFFVLGRNPALSRAEIISYLESIKISWKILLAEKSFLILETSGEVSWNIQEFGGIIKLGKINFSGTEPEFLYYIENEDLTELEKFSYCVFGNVDEEVFSQKFKRERRKATIRRGRRNLQVQGGDYIALPNAEVEFFAFQDKIVYFGVVEQDYSYSEVKERDMKKPVRRQELGISPRLAKILINLSQVRHGQLLLDPFCGVGGILQEALLKGINVYGVDKDPRAIESARANLKWLENKYSPQASWKLINSDSRNINIRYDAIATEPALGEIIRYKPKDTEAKNIISSFENLIISVLSKISRLKKGNGKIVLTFPFIREFSVNIENICRKTGLKIHQLEGIKFPIKEYREDQFISREIYVFQ